MCNSLRVLRLSCLSLAVAVGGILSGCQSLGTQNLGLQNNELIAKDLFPEADLTGHPNREAIELMRKPPTELSMITMPEYVIEISDILLIDAVRLAPKPPYYIRSLDVLFIMALGAYPDSPIQQPYQVQPSGKVDLGPTYGSVHIAGLSISEAHNAIDKHLREELGDPGISIQLLQPSGQQQIAGEHLVGPDGMVNLGVYGKIYINGMTVTEARATIEEHLSKYLDDPQISLQVFAYNSKMYYIYIEGAGFGDQTFAIPITGNETVLDAIAQIRGIPRMADKKSIWIARPSPDGLGANQILPIDLAAIVKGGEEATNYQLFPGDRLYIGGDRIMAFDNFIAKFTAPFERMLGFTLLGSQTIQTVQRFPKGNFRRF